MAETYYPVTIIRADGATLNVNDGATYAAASTGLWDVPSIQPILTQGPSRAVLVDAVLQPRTFALLITVEAGRNTTGAIVRNDLHNAARDALLAMLPAREIVTVETEYPGVGTYALQALLTQAQWQEGLPQYLATFLAGDPVLVGTDAASALIALDTTHRTKTVTLTVGGNQPALPILVFTPTLPKTDSWNTARRYTIANIRNVALQGYAVGLPFDFAWHIANGRLGHVNGDDIRVLAGNQLVDRWFGDFDGSSSNPRIWIEVDLPPLGALDILVLYGNSSALAWTNSTDGPMFDLETTDNDHWRYHGRFRDTPGAPTSHSWQWSEHLPGRGFAPIATHLGSPWDATEAVGVNAAGGYVPVAGEVQGYAGLSIHHPLWLAAVSHSGETWLDPALIKFALRARTDEGLLLDEWTTPVAAQGSLTAYGPILTAFAQEREAVAFALRSTTVHVTQNTTPIGGADRVSLTLATPVAVTGAGSGSGNEEFVYMLEALVENLTTGESLSLTGVITPLAVGPGTTRRLTAAPQLATMAGEPWYYALTLIPPIRGEWLTLRPGANHDPRCGRAGGRA
jgi:hypothetical protein